MAGPAPPALFGTYCPRCSRRHHTYESGLVEYERQGYDNNTLNGEGYGFRNLFPTRGGRTFMKRRSSLVFANGDRPGSRDTLQASRETQFPLTAPPSPPGCWISLRLCARSGGPVEWRKRHRERAFRG